MAGKIAETIIAIGICGALVTLCIIGLLRAELPNPVGNGLAVVVVGCYVSVLVLLGASSAIAFVKIIQEIWSKP